MRLRDLKRYIDGLDEGSEFAVVVSAIETEKVFAQSYAVEADISEHDELLLKIDVELCPGCSFLRKYDWRKNDAARCVVADTFSHLSFDSMRKRRTAVKSIVAALRALRDSQLAALENTPHNFRVSDNYELGEAAVDAFEQACDILEEIL